MSDSLAGGSSRSAGTRFGTDLLFSLASGLAGFRVGGHTVVLHLRVIAMSDDAEHPCQSRMDMLREQDINLCVKLL